ncbi:MAG: ATP-dependent DNA helicase RecG [Paludibacteraceae bacterium]|nr:ATP-dependent DNA helicase RecG [Paludibacteraceae bacterium]
MPDFLEKEITYLPGVGPKKADVLKKELNVSSYGDLLYCFPYRYIDRSKFYRIRDVSPASMYVQIRGIILKVNTQGEGRKQRVVILFSDGESTIELLFFKGVKYILEKYKPGHEYVVFGKVSEFNGQYNLVHPDMETINEAMSKQALGGVQGMYNTSEKMKNAFLTSRVLQKYISEIFNSMGEARIPESLPSYLVEQHHMMSRHDALKNVHFPQTLDALRLAQFRLKFEELFVIQLNMLRQRNYRRLRFVGFKFTKIGDTFNSFYKHNLPFELTNAQKKVIKEIYGDLSSGKQMNRLLQGDVGSGKTMVALMSMLMALDNGFQASMMAPTEILAQQHFASISQMLNGMDVRVALLTGSSKKKEREAILQGVRDGSVQILIGTHALLEDDVVFSRLGLVVIDEQHRFGVAQRAKLWSKSDQPPHVLVMTATPIPRTLAMTLYGDLDVSVIDELPPGRKPVQTIHRLDNARGMLYDFIKKQIALGRQAYIVYPMIQESERSDYANIEAGYESLQQVFPEPQYHLGMVHGKMKPEEKDAQMRQFAAGELNILVATTVIEVGVNVPNASVMLIESAERFGLSQLHQLRGRVGRGADQSYCMLVTSPKLSSEGRQRMEVMTRTNNGFEISEVDLKMRGPGDLEGTQQSGVAISLKIANLATDGQIIQFAREVAETVLDEDPDLLEEKNILLNQRLDRMARETKNWGVIS